MKKIGMVLNKGKTNVKELWCFFLFKEINFEFQLLLLLRTVRNWFFFFFLLHQLIPLHIWEMNECDKKAKQKQSCWISANGWMNLIPSRRLVQLVFCAVVWIVAFFPTTPTSPGLLYKYAIVVFESSSK